MSSADVETSREMLERFNRGDYEEATAMLHDEVELRQWGALPDPDTYVGKEEVVHGLTRWLSGFEPGFQFVPEELTDCGDSVLIKIQLRGKGRSSGVELERIIFHLYEVRNGKVFRMRVFSSEDEAREAAGMPERR